MAASILDRIEQLRRVNPQLLALIEQQQGFAFPVRSGGRVRLTGDKSAALGIQRRSIDLSESPRVTNNFLSTKWRASQPALGDAPPSVGKRVLQKKSNSAWGFEPIKVRGGLTPSLRDRAKSLLAGGGPLPDSSASSSVVSSDLPDGLRITEDEIARITEDDEYRVVEES